MMEDAQEWEKAKQVVEAIQHIMCGPSGEPTAENPVVEGPTTVSGGQQTKTRKILNVDYDKHVAELAKQKVVIDKLGASAIERLKKKWAEEAAGTTVVAEENSG